MACGQTSWMFHQDELDAPDVRALLEHHIAESRADSPPEACHVLPIDRLRDPAIHFIALRSGTRRLLGIGALKALDPGHGEIKSMRAHPEALGMGVGKTVLAELIAMARAIGMIRLSLETGNSALFAAANRLYEGAGFVRCGPFGGYPPTEFTHFYTREI